MLLTEIVKTSWHSKNRKWYESKGFVFTKYKDKFEVNVKDLLSTSGVLVDVKCDCENCTTPITKPITWNSYLRGVKEDGKYYCKKCCQILYGVEKYKIARLKKGISFEKWCINNNRQDVLDRWDYDLNDCKPSEITHSNSKQYYFKCPIGIHESELKRINNFVNGWNGTIECSACKNYKTKNWKGGITSISLYLRREMEKWRINSLKFYNYKCVLTGINSSDLVIHHTYSFNKIFEETLNILNIPIFDKVNKYTDEELVVLKNKCLELHYKYGLGKPLIPEIHKLFHSLYGKSNNTLEQFNEFDDRFNNHEFDKELNIVYNK